MKLERFEQGIGMPIEEFIDIITSGFYYINFKKKEIFWYGNRAVYVGNGYDPHTSNMLVTSHLYEANEGTKVEDGHYWDWKKKEYVFNFKDYNKTWSAKEEVLKKVLAETIEKEKV